MKILMHAFDTETGIPYGQINLQMQTGKNPAWTQKASILSEFGTEQLELIQTSLKTGNPVYAQKTEAVIRFLNQKYPDKVGGKPYYSSLIYSPSHPFLARPGGLSHDTRLTLHAPEPATLSTFQIF